VKVWKVILATIVIFAAGAFAGGIFAKTFSKPPRQVPPLPFTLSQQRFQERLKKELQLTSEQTNRIDKIFSESNERMKILWGLIGPEVQKELQEVRENIRAELNPEQRQKFEQLVKQSQHRPDGRRARGTNQASSATNSASPTNR
jgi:hypothetical protein